MLTTSSPSQVPPAGMVTPPSGLTDAEVSQRFAAGQTNAADVRTSRSIPQIVRANVFTVFNALLAALFVVTMATERWQNGLFGVVIVVNAGIGIVQEWRAKRILDRLALLNAPHARVVRNATLLDVDVGAVVLDDLLEVRAGDQVPADGQVRESWGLEVDESLLTGESEPVVKAAGHRMLSGSIVVAGQGRFQATAVGADAYATRLTVEARRFTVTYSELVADTNRLLRWISVTIALVAPVLIWSQFRSPDNHGWQDAVTGTVAALVGMVPEGLVLLISLAFMIATIALARRSTLVQELPAVEALARVDVVCLDKTGTLTDGDVRFDRLELFSGSREADVRNALGLLARAGGANTTAAALSAVMPVSPWRQVDTVAFSSARKWSAVVTDGHGSWVLGAPEMVIHSPVSKEQTSARERADAFAADGSRVLLLAHTDSGVRSDTGLAPDLFPDALVVLAEHLREDAEQTLSYFTDQGVALKVISGDNPHTVGAVATMLHLPGLRSAADAVDARTLPQDTQELGEVLENHRSLGG